jgi:hypothetical protein
MAGPNSKVHSFLTRPGVHIFVGEDIMKELIKFYRKSSVLLPHVLLGVSLVATVIMVVDPTFMVNSILETAMPAIIVGSFWWIGFRCTEYKEYEWNVLNTLQLLIYRLEGSNVEVVVKPEYANSAHVLLLVFVGVKVTVKQETDNA